MVGLRSVEHRGVGRPQIFLNAIWIGSTECAARIRNPFKSLTMDGDGSLDETVGLPVKIMVLVRVDNYVGAEIASDLSGRDRVCLAHFDFIRVGVTHGLLTDLDSGVSGER